MSASLAGPKSESIISRRGCESFSPELSWPRKNMSTTGRIECLEQRSHQVPNLTRHHSPVARGRVLQSSHDGTPDDHAIRYVTQHSHVFGPADAETDAKR